MKTETTIVINCTKDQKNKLVRASQSQNMKLGPWVLGVLEKDMRKNDGVKG